jgi:AcrR family transcriptional regulator
MKKGNRKETRQRMIGAATLLLRERGYDGTGFREVVSSAGAARGAIYHHFPGGKQELGTEVALSIGGMIGNEIERICASDAPLQAVGEILDLADAVLIRGDLVPGCPIAAVTLASEDPGGELRAAADSIFTRWQGALTGCLERGGISTKYAAGYSAMTMASIEGTVILCRAHGDATPLEHVRAGLLEHLEAISARPGSGQTDTDKE